MKLLNRNGKEIKIRNKDQILRYIQALENISKRNPTKNAIDKFNSLLSSETFLSLFTEGEISSRRDIRKVFNDKNFSKENELKTIKNFFLAYEFVLSKKEFSISNIFTLYNLLSQDSIKKENKLLDNHMFRDQDVFISSNKMDVDYKGYDAKDIAKSLLNLIHFLKNENENFYLRAIIGHIYFEMIHPFFDFNGRTGRFLPLWLFSNEDRTSKMMYFATAMGNYRERYLSLFKKYIDIRTYEVDLDKMVIEITKLLILNQYQYIWLKNTENNYLDKTKKSFTNFQKDFLWLLMKKSEVSHSETAWFKVTKKDHEFLEIKLRNATLSEDTRKLKEAKIIDISKDKPRKYKLLNYKLIDFNKLL